MRNHPGRVAFQRDEQGRSGHGGHFRCGERCRQQACRRGRSPRPSCARTHRSGDGRQGGGRRAAEVEGVAQAPPQGEGPRTERPGLGPARVRASDGRLPGAPGPLLRALAAPVPARRVGGGRGGRAGRPPRRRPFRGCRHRGLPCRGSWTGGRSPRPGRRSRCRRSASRDNRCGPPGRRRTRAPCGAPPRGGCSSPWRSARRFRWAAGRRRCRRGRGSGPSGSATRRRGLRSRSAGAGRGGGRAPRRAAPRRAGATRRPGARSRSAGW